MNVLDYFPYGKISREYRAEGSERYLTTGHERDEETGLDNRGARWYDSDVARFLSLDPKAAQYVGWNSYCYVLDNPANSLDPDGKKVYNGNAIFLIEAQQNLFVAQKALSAISDQTSNEYKAAQKSVSEAQANVNVEQQLYDFAQSRIDLIKQNWPALHDMVNKLTDSKKEEIDIYITASSKPTGDHNESASTVPSLSFFYGPTGKPTNLPFASPGKSWDITLYASSDNSALANEYGDAIFAAKRPLDWVTGENNDKLMGRPYGTSSADRFSFKVQHTFEKILHQHNRMKKGLNVNNPINTNDENVINDELNKPTYDEK